MILDASEMVRFLTTYPRLDRQPYNMHLLLDKCMFAHQRETEVVINFLLCTQSCTSSFDVPPIVGPKNVGKSSLVAHICKDERVSDCFPQIIIFRHDYFRTEDIAALRDKCAARHEKTNGRLLIIVDVVGDLNEDLWKIFYSLCRQSTTSGSKIIITSRSDKITKLGTAQTLVLKHLSHEAFWYFFKVITFGSTDPRMHPTLVCLAMEIAELMNANLVEANITACVLRANFNTNFWCKVLTFRRGYIQNHLCKFGEQLYELLSENRPMYLQRMGRSTEDVFVLDTNQTSSSEEEVSKIKALDVWFGTTRPQGIFKILAWKSPIPAYHSYIQTYEIREVQARAVKRKRHLMNGLRHV
ncbi:unnamed protein product [Triticum turgidum subsp. durum]|uniref:NB-ARC domain-containing protein n=1 Tax=Triticum turgidum subsp. durum TaxID=4567 RepID=A0A9R0TDC7_TRITD|nr:unnamed protein product [Triticum turgidum subsp. durum]